MWSVVRSRIYSFSGWVLSSLMVFFLLKQLPPLREEVQFVLLFTFFCHVYHNEWSPICICVCGTLCSCCRSRCVCLNRPCDHIRVKRSENKVPGPASWDLHAVLGSLIQNRQQIRQSPHSLWATSDWVMTSSAAKFGVLPSKRVRRMAITITLIFTAAVLGVTTIREASLKQQSCGGHVMLPAVVFSTHQILFSMDTGHRNRNRWKLKSVCHLLLFPFSVIVGK